MVDVLLISDDLRRAERMARDLHEQLVCRVHDLYDDDAPSGRSDLIVSDVAQLTSEALVRLRRHLTVARGDGVPLLFLVHGNAARAEVQARLLDATETLGAAVATRLLGDRLARLSETSKGVPGAEPANVTVGGHVRGAERFLKSAFFSGETVTPTIADVGTDLVARAVHEAGIRDWVAAVRRFDDVTHQHILLVAGLATAFAGALGLNAVDRHCLAKTALLHDVGKTKIPAAILNKPGRLEGEELRVMREHTALGHTMLVDGGFDSATLAVVRSHHEMLDGSGYPDGLRGGEIPDLVRLVSVCDIYAALIERRPYKAALSGVAALAILEKMTGRLDGDLVRAFRPVAFAFDPSKVGAAA